jgi:alpha-glucosidase
VVRQITKEFRKRKIPCDTIVLDIDYMDDYRVFTISRQRFPRFEKMVNDLSRIGFRVVTIVDPGVKKSPTDATYREGIKLRAFCTNADGAPFVCQVWPGPACLPDFMQDNVRTWWGDKLTFLLSRGVAGIWNDMNEPALFGNQRPLSADTQELPKDNSQLFLQHDAGGTVGHFEVRNVYGQQMARATSEALHKTRPGERSFALSRSGYAGIQRYCAVWLGDNKSWFEHLRLSIPMLLNVSLSGVAFCGVDIGGFGENTDAELLVRWYQLGVFYPFCRNHCALDGRPQEPWTFGPKVEAAIRRLIALRYQLLPYIERLFVEHRQTGAPLMRPMAWHYPHDQTARELDDQFLLGGDLLVAPILHRGKSRRVVYLPKGRWFQFDGGPPLSGARFYDFECSLSHTPAFVREGAILPLASSVQHTGELASAPITFRCYGNRASGRYWQDDGSSLGYERGEYNDWTLTFAGGRFSSKCAHRGYSPPNRQYFYEAAGRRHWLRNWPPKATPKATSTD